MKTKLTGHEYSLLLGLIDGKEHHAPLKNHAYYISLCDEGLIYYDIFKDTIHITTAGFFALMDIRDCKNVNCVKGKIKNLMADDADGKTVLNDCPYCNGNGFLLALPKGVENV